MGERVGIQIFARVKPTKRAFAGVTLHEPEEGHRDVDFAIPRDDASGHVNNTKESFKFRCARPGAAAHHPRRAPIATAQVQPHLSGRLDAGGGV